MAPAPLVAFVRSAARRTCQPAPSKAVQDENPIKHMFSPQFYGFSKYLKKTVNIRKGPIIKYYLHILMCDAVDFFSTFDYSSYPKNLCNYHFF